MPWRETNPMEQRIEFINKFLTGHWTMAELSDRFGISRTTGYKWWERFKQTGFEGLNELSRLPIHVPTAPPPKSRRSSSLSESATPSGVRSHCSSWFSASTLTGTCRRRLLRGRSSNATAWSNRERSGRGPDTQASHTSTRPSRTMFGQPTSKASSRQRTTSTAIP